MGCETRQHVRHPARGRVRRRRRADGYGNLLGPILGRRVGKSASFTRWDARPLTDEQLSYAAEDVAHLLELSDELQRRLAESGRLEWAREECRRIENATDERDPETAWERLPRVGQLDPQLARGCQGSGCMARADAATEDRPVGSVLADPALVELAKRHPSETKGLEHIRGLHPSQIKKRGAAVLEAIIEGLAAPPIPREPARGRSEPGDAPLIALAEALLRARALAAGLAYELLASRAELEQIVSAARRGEPEPDVRTCRAGGASSSATTCATCSPAAGRLGVGADLKLDRRRSGADLEHHRHRRGAVEQRVRQRIDDWPRPVDPPRSTSWRSPAAVEKVSRSVCPGELAALCAPVSPWASDHPSFFSRRPSSRRRMSDES